MTRRPLFATLDVAGEPLRALEMDHPWVVAEVTDDMDGGIAVYYDRRWGLTGAFCRFLLKRPELVEGHRVLAAGAGIGLEAVVLGRLARSVVVNDLAPAALRLAARQLEENGIEGFTLDAGRFEESDLDVDLVVACFVVYDAETRDATAELLRRAAERSLPVLLANEDVGPFFREVVDSAPAPVEVLATLERGRVVRVG